MGGAVGGCPSDCGGRSFSLTDQRLVFPQLIHQLKWSFLLFDLLDFQIYPNTYINFKNENVD